MKSLIKLEHEFLERTYRRAAPSAVRLNISHVQDAARKVHSADLSGALDLLQSFPNYPRLISCTHIGLHDVGSIALEAAP